MRRLLRKVKLLFRNLFGKRRIVRLGIYGETNTGKTTLANKISMDWLGKPVGVVSDMPHETRTVQKVEHIEITAAGKKLIMNLLDMPGLATQIDYKEFTKYRKINQDSIEVKLNDLKVADLKKLAKEINIKVSGKKASILSKIRKNFDEKDLPDFVKKLKLKPIKRKTKKYTKDEARKIAEEATKGVVEAIKWLDNVDVVLAMMDSTKDPLTQVNIMLIGNLEAKGIPVVIVANKTDLEKANPESIQNAFPQHPVVSISALKGSNLNQLYQTIAEYSA